MALCEGNPPITDRFLTKASDAGLLSFIWYTPEQTVEQRFGAPVIWDTTELIMMSL